MSADVGQLELALGPFRNVRLLSEHFLAERLPTWPEFAELHEVARARFAEQGGFLDWLGGLVGAPIHRLDGSGALMAYDGLGVDGVLGVLRANRRRLSRDPDSRALRETIDSEHAQSVARLGSLRTRLVRAERAADEEVYALYRIGTMVGVGVETR